MNSSPRNNGSGPAWYLPGLERHLGSVSDALAPRRRKREEADLSIYSLDELDAVALELNPRPRARFGFASSLAVYTIHMDQLNNPIIAVS